jgi:uncharacterized LabA/DUF88 family protein
MAIETFTLFIDAQNFYNEARRAFFSPLDSHIYGQINPMELVNLICSRPPVGITRTLHEVRVYSGRPDSGKDAKTHAAHMKQCAAWTRTGATVITRPLRYPKDWPNSKAQEKGIDVTLAIDIITFAVDCVHNVAVIASFDTDLNPAIEFVRLRFAAKCRIEVIGFNSTQTRKRRIRVPGHNLWCYWLDKIDYDAIADLTDYNL